jgi:ferrochelatase
MTAPSNPAGGARDARWAVLLLAHGAPERLEDIPEFLLNVRGGRRLPDAAVEEIVRRYAQIGGGSPLRKLTELQARALARRISAPVYVGMRNWTPFIAETVLQMAADGITEAVAVCLAPQNSRTSIGLYRQRLFEAVEKFHPSLEVDFVEHWHDEPLLIEAFAEKVTQALSRLESETGRRVPVILTAHSVPEHTIQEGDPYAGQVRETATRVAEAAEIVEWQLAFQSQGMTAGPWIGPTVESVLDSLAAAGHQHVLIAPIGFVSDHVEILYDIDVVFREYGRTKGIEVARTESLNDSELFIRALAALVEARRRARAQIPGDAR